VDSGNTRPETRKLVLVAFMLVFIVFVFYFFMPFREPIVEPSTTTTSTTLREATVTLMSTENIAQDMEKIQQIIVSGDASRCEKIDGLGYPHIVDTCYYHIAYNSRNETSCGLIKEKTLGEKCKERISELNDIYGQLTINFDTGSKNDVGGEG
jgi:hypothetical protein